MGIDNADEIMQNFKNLGMLMKENCIINGKQQTVWTFYGKSAFIAVLAAVDEMLNPDNSF